MSMNQSDPSEANGTSSRTVLRPGRPHPSRILPIVLGLLLYLCLYTCFYPSIYAVSDERDYLTTASAIKTGLIFDRESDEVYSARRTVDGVRPFLGRSLVYSAIIACMLFIHWKATFLVVLACHLLTFVLVALVFEKTGKSPWWAWLVLLHPGLTLWSRTVLADVPSATLVAAVMFFLLVEPRKPLAAGAAAGFAMLLRPTNCLLGLAVGLSLLWEDVTRREQGPLPTRLWRGQLKWFLLPYVVFCILVLASNTVLYGGPLHTRYTGTVVFGVTYLARHLPLYLLSLSAFWPLMLLGLFFLPQRIRFFGIAFVVIELLFFSANINFARGHNLVAMLLRCTRYLTGVVVVLCVGYPGLVAWLTRYRKIPTPVAVGVAVAAIAGTTALFYEHSKYLAQQAAVVEAAYSCIPEDARIFTGPNAGELFSPIFGNRDKRGATGSFIERGYEDVAAGDYFVFYFQPPPRTPWQDAFARAAEKMLAALETVAELRAVPVPKEAAALRIFEVQRRRPNVHLPPLTEAETYRLFPRRQDYEYYGGD